MSETRCGCGCNLSVQNCNDKYAHEIEFVEQLKQNITVTMRFLRDKDPRFTTNELQDRLAYYVRVKKKIDISILRKKKYLQI